MHIASWLSTSFHKIPSWWIKSKWMRTIWINFLWNTPRIKKFKKNCSWQIQFCSFCWYKNVWKIVWSVLLNPNLKVASFLIHMVKEWWWTLRKVKGMLSLSEEIRGSPWSFWGSHLNESSLQSSDMHIWPVTVHYSTEITSTNSSPAFKPCLHYFSPKQSF